MIVIKEEYVPVSRRATPKNAQRRNIQEAISSHIKKNVENGEKKWPFQIKTEERKYGSNDEISRKYSNSERNERKKIYIKKKKYIYAMDRVTHLEWRTATCWGSAWSQESSARQTEQSLSKGGASWSGHPTSNTRGFHRPISFLGNDRLNTCVKYFKLLLSLLF